MPLHRICGLTVLSDFPLTAPPAVGSEPEVTVISGPAGPIPEGAPSGRIIAASKPPWPPLFAVRTEDGYTLRFDTVCDVTIDADLRHVELRPASEAARPFSYILFDSVIATILTLGGECVLHASAIQSNDRVAAFVGPPGTGKSTLAALLCSRGARLLSDDLLRLQPAPGGGFECFSGSHEIRLRPAASPLASSLPGSATVTADGRTGVILNEGEARLPLTVLIFPKPSRTITELQVKRLDEGAALLELTRYPRTLGWLAPDIIEQSFRWNARLAREVPAYEVVVPWGPPFDPSIEPKLLSLLDDHP